MIANVRASPGHACDGDAADDRPRKATDSVCPEHDVEIRVALPQREKVADDQVNEHGHPPGAQALHQATGDEYGGTPSSADNTTAQREKGHGHDHGTTPAKDVGELPIQRLGGRGGQDVCIAEPNVDAVVLAGAGRDLVRWLGGW